MKFNGHTGRPLDELSCLKAFASSYKYIADNKDQACALVNNILKVPSHTPIQLHWCMSGLHESEIWAINIDINCPHSGEVPSYLYISLLTFLKFYHQIKNKYALYVNVSVDSEAKCKICVDKSLLMFWHLWSELSSFTNRLFNILVEIRALKKNHLWQFMR